MLGRDRNRHIRITPLGDVGSHNPPPLGDVLVGTPRPGLGSDTKLSHPDPGFTTSRARSTTVTRYCPLLGLDYALTVLFLGTHTRTSQWVTHHGNALARYSLNFGVPTEPEASEFPKCLVLGRDGNIHIRITPLGDVGSHNFLGPYQANHWL